jgi:DNA-binding HxlR family transcriptional regulator
MRQTYGQFCPVALASEVLAERWTLLVVRELLCGATRFNEIRRGVPRLSATLLKQRLRTLEHAGIIRRQPVTQGRGIDYLLTDAGRELSPIVNNIGEWGQRWARDIRHGDLDPGWLVWNIRRRLNLGSLPPGRTVIEIEFTDARSRDRRFWLVHEDGDVQVCLKDPGYDTTIRLVSGVRVLTELWFGMRTFAGEIRAGNLRLFGSPSHCRALPNWLLLSEAATIKRVRSANPVP